MESVTDHDGLTEFRPGWIDPHNVGSGFPPRGRRAAQQGDSSAMQDVRRPNSGWCFPRILLTAACLAIGWGDGRLQSTTHQGDNSSNRRPQPLSMKMFAEHLPWARTPIRRNNNCADRLSLGLKSRSVRRWLEAAHPSGHHLASDSPALEHPRTWSGEVEERESCYCALLAH